MAPPGVATATATDAADAVAVAVAVVCLLFRPSLSRYVLFVIMMKTSCGGHGQGRRRAGLRRGQADCKLNKRISEITKRCKRLLWACIIFVFAFYESAGK